MMKSFKKFSFLVRLIGTMVLTLSFASVSSAAIEMHVHSINTGGRNTVTGISDGSNGAQDINSFSSPRADNYGTTPLTPPYFDSAVQWTFDGGGNVSESPTTYGLENLITPTTITLNDDETTSGGTDITVPFTFNMFGNTVDTIRVSSNGYAMIESNVSGGLSSNSGCCSGQDMSSQGVSGDDYLIAGVWSDLYPPGTPNSIRYETLNAAPNRIFVLEFNETSQCCDSNGGNTFQLKIFEGSGPPPGTPPEAITNLQGVAGNGQVDLSWSEPVNNGPAITNYLIQYADNPGFIGETSINNGTNLTANIAGLTNFQIYYFRVYATNADGNSPVSNIVSATPIPCNSLQNNDLTPSPYTVESQSCIGITVFPGDLSIINVPDTINFPRKFIYSVAQNSFNNSDNTTGPDDVLTIANLTNLGFDVQISAQDFTSGANTIARDNLYIATTIPDNDDITDPDLLGSNINGVKYSTSYSGANDISAPFNVDKTIDPVNQAPTFTSLTGNTFNNSPLSIMTTATPHVGAFSINTNFYLNIPANPNPGTYATVFTIDLLTI